MRRRASAAAVAGLLLVASACSDGDGDVTAVSAASAPDTIAATDESESSAPDTDAPTTASGREPTTPPAPTVVPDAATELDWGACDDLDDPTGTIECATLAVPLDHSRPDGEQIDVVVARIDTASGDDQIGSLVMNPGGPGGSGVDFLVQASFTVPPSVQERFDLVSFDPRGVGRSAAVECETSYDDDVPLLDAGDDAGWAELVADAETLLDTCDAGSQALFPWVGTNNAARDLDRIREALGDDGLTFLGYSYGTRLGATYAELFPARIRAMVLDGAVAPSTDELAEAETDAAGFDRALENFAAACDADDDCALHDLGTTIDVIERLEADIAEAGSFGTDDEGRVLTPGEMQLAVFAALYSQDYWPYLAMGLADADTEQDGSLLQALADVYLTRHPDGTYDNLFTANIAINCADQAERPPADAQRALADQAAAASTYFPEFLRTNTGCLGVPPALDPIVIGPAVGAPPILVIGNTGDPATPYESAVVLADFLDSGVLFTVEGEGHTAYGAIECVAEPVNAYLIDLELPDAGDASCTDEADGDVFLPAGESELETFAALFACLADNGLDVPDIGVDELLADPLGESYADAIDPNVPAFNDAALACADLIPI